MAVTEAAIATWERDLVQGLTVKWEGCPVLTAEWEGFRHVVDSGVAKLSVM
jgi:hypothetical protein